MRMGDRVKAGSKPVIALINDNVDLGLTEFIRKLVVEYSTLDFVNTQVRPALAGHWGDKLLTLELAHSVDMHAVIVRATAAQPSGLKADLLPGTDASWTKIGMPSACASESDFPSGTPKYERFSHSNESRVLTLGPFYAVRTDQTTRSTTRPSSRSSTWLRCATLSAHFSNHV